MSTEISNVSEQLNLSPHWHIVHPLLFQWIIQVNDGRGLLRKEVAGEI